MQNNQDTSMDDNEFFLHIYSQYNRLLLHYAILMLWDRNEAGDVMQITYLKIFNHIGKINGLHKQDMVNYMITIVKNTAIDFNRQRRKRISIEIHEKNKLEDNEERYASMMNTHEIWEAWEEIKPLYGIPLLLQVWYGMTNTEIGILLGISETCVATRIFRGKREWKARFLDS